MFSVPQSIHRPFFYQNEMIYFIKTNKVGGYNQFKKPNNYGKF